MPQTNNHSGREPPEECPACGDASLSYRAEIESWLCDGCSYVLDSEAVSTASETTEEATGETQQVDWESQIAVSDTAEANLIDALSRTEAVADAVGLSDERTLRAGEVIAEAWQTNFMHGRSQERTIGATIYAVSREVDAAIPPAMIADAVEADRSSIKQTFQEVTHELGLNIGPPVPREFVAAICDALEMSAHVERRARHILGQQDAAGGNPIGIAAAAIYVACEQSDVAVTLQELAAGAGLTEEPLWRQTSGVADDVLN